MRAHVWIAHQRYPTKGRVWHPGGAHPFVGMNEALVHNGDFANYHSVSEYLAQRNIFPAVPGPTRKSPSCSSICGSRVYGYPLEYIIEALAPTTELDFDQLPAEKQRSTVRSRRRTCTARPTVRGSSSSPAAWPRPASSSSSASPTPRCFGPRSSRCRKATSSIGLICSEKAGHRRYARQPGQRGQAVHADGSRPYWNARGGSHTDGGAFVLTVSPDQRHELLPATNGNGHYHHEGHRQVRRDRCALPAGTDHCDLSTPIKTAGSDTDGDLQRIEQAVTDGDAQCRIFEHIRDSVAELGLRPAAMVRRTRLADRTARQNAPALGHRRADAVRSTSAIPPAARNEARY